jgi:hypothetical protein
MNSRENEATKNPSPSPHCIRPAPLPRGWSGQSSAIIEVPARVATYQFGRAVGGLPGNDVVFAACKHIGGDVDLREIDPNLALRRPSGNA